MREPTLQTRPSVDMTHEAAESILDRADMQRLAAGDDAALDDLMVRHAPRLLSYLTRCLQNEADAQDATQETFVRVYKNRVRFNANQRFSTWLYAIATNLVRDRYRYRLRHPQVSIHSEQPVTGGEFGDNLPDDRPSPSEYIQAHERAEAVSQAVAELAEELRIPLILFEYEELSHAEIGEVLGCSAKAVEMRIYRARQQLRACLSQLLETF